MITRANRAWCARGGWSSGIGPTSRKFWPPQLFRDERRASSDSSASTTIINGKPYPKDAWTNTLPSIVSYLGRNLHLQPGHPISITRKLIESIFPGYKFHNTLSPIVSVGQNFDSLGFPADHVGRNRTDTYYVNKDTVLRTHTSAHQADVFAADESDGWLISADVYRRDAIDRSHYPVFHQMEGARTWDRSKLPPGTTMAQTILDDLTTLPKHNVEVSDPNPTIIPESNPLQAEYHSIDEVEAASAHLKRSLENVVVEIFTQARRAAIIAAGNDATATAEEEPLQVRWVTAYFPFTSPSWELEVFWQGEWLEVLGCGIVKQDIMLNAGVGSRFGWAFGVGLERIAMLLFSIPDIRLFWSTDPRFLSQFSSTAPSAAGGKTSSNSGAADSGEGKHTFNITRFVPFSKHPACPKDVSFWTNSAFDDTNIQQFHENDMMELVRDIAGSSAESVSLIDEFTHPKTGRRSVCYRVNYRSLERTLTSDEANAMHERLREKLVETLGVELR
ncbi:phenylalanyl-tRNA synthetase [Aulographum hederae CBS 113979]|uniref:Phenylalanine--tRNA ligase, mitochondrial n=1 Tax=Aulographum hederae CBS 113979 TaxID=1176131 RepID=A0A6G1H765_9PEZI|nr:phenylalanyl-tRNA synthetase [Aulographum hederae CBS 113979]